VGRPTELCEAMNVQVTWARIMRNSIYKQRDKYPVRRGHSRCVHIEHIIGMDGTLYEHRVPVYSSRNSMKRRK